MIRIELIVSAIAIAGCLPIAAQAQGYQDLNSAPQGYGGAPALRGPVPGTPTQYVNPQQYQYQQPVAGPGAPVRVPRSNNVSVVGTAVGAPGKAVKTGVGMTDRTVKTGMGMTDRTVKTGVGMTDRTVKTGVGLTDRAVKTTVGAPLKAVKETFKMVF